MNNVSDELVLIDGSGYIFRAYYALPPMFKSDGTPVNAVFGFSNMLLKLVEDIQEEKGGFVSIAVIFDASRETFRNKIYPQYKANRSDPPEDLIPQFQLIKKVPESFNLQSIELQGYEADDLIASYCVQAISQKKKVTIISADKDLMQLIRPNVTMIDPMKKSQVTEKTVLEKFGVLPNKVIDVQALAGDSSDNVPGIPGIGPKIAAQLINEYQSLEKLLENAEKIKQEKRRDSIIQNREMAIISKKLVTLREDINLPKSIDELKFQPLNVEKLIKFCESMEFNRIKTTVISRYGLKSIIKSDDVNEKKKNGLYIPLRKKIDRDNYVLISDKDNLSNWVKIAREKGSFSIDCETNSLHVIDSSIVGFSMSFEDSKSCYIPISHSQGNQINIKDFVLIMEPILKDSTILKIGQNIKFDILILKKIGLEVNNFDDTMLMSYVLRTGERGHSLNELSKDFLLHEPLKFEDITTVNKKKLTFDQVDIDSALTYAAEDADLTFRLWEILRIKLIENKLYDFYFYFERPLIKTICEMEFNGCRIDNIELLKLSQKFSGQMKVLENEIHKEAGEKFNVGSPKQLGEVLFSKLNLPHSKKGKSGNYQTDVKILEKLKSEKFLIAEKILEWRQFSKLKNTYCEGLLARQSNKTGRIHTSFGMASTLTGRLSSNDPNLQNIPIKSNAGRQIRKAFISDNDSKIVSIDYSQIELRILAHVAKIDALINAFVKEEDIHTVTAKEVFQVTEEEVSTELRRRAKIINFGIIYGISPYGLAVQLDISNSEAKEFIVNYFKRYPGIKDYMESTIQNCKINGFVSTPFGRRIFIPFINDKLALRRNFAERSAINAPIQGGSADLIKLAMPKVLNFVKENKLKSKILLQVHDELIFEVPNCEVDIIKNEIPKIMTTCHEPYIKTDVPLKAEFGIGENWDDAH
ncbi:MAG: DNA polymerase I [Rickettsiales bacterium]|nr:DNA polymerase I [Rickettsiales bacterium]